MDISLSFLQKPALPLISQMNEGEGSQNFAKKKKDRVFCLCAQSRENKKVKKCVKLKYGCCG